MSKMIHKSKNLSQLSFSNGMMSSLSILKKRIDLLNKDMLKCLKFDMIRSVESKIQAKLFRILNLVILLEKMVKIQSKRNQNKNIVNSPRILKTKMDSKKSLELINSTYAEPLCHMIKVLQDYVLHDPSIYGYSMI